MKINDIKAVNSKIEAGAWVRDLPNLPGIAVKVRGTFNSDYTRLMRKLRAGYRPEELSEPAIEQEIETQLLAEATLIDWHGIEDAPYSPETAKVLLSDPEMSVFRQAIVYAGNVVAREGKASLEADAKN